MDLHNCYGEFAKVYDIFMQDTPYDSWVEYLEKIWKTPKDIAELGCGTGNMTVRLANKGYDMIGIDLSEEMLTVAREKAQHLDEKILFLNQDMTEFELYGTVDCIICLCDSINYVLEDDGVQAVFHLVNNYLNPEGLFIFDMNTHYKYSEMMADQTFAQSFDEGAYIWENDFDEDSMINEYAMDFFVKTKSGLYERFEENHLQRAYSIEQMKMMLDKAGLEVLHVYDDMTFNKVHDKSERVHFVAQTRKGGQKDE